MPNQFLEEFKKQIQPIREYYMIGEKFTMLKSMPAELRKKNKQIFNLRQNITETTENIARWERKITKAVLNEKTSNDKPKFSNDSIRKTEIADRVENDTAILSLIKQKQEMETFLANREIEIQEIKDEARVLFKQIDVYLGELNFLTSLVAKEEVKKDG